MKTLKIILINLLSLIILFIFFELSWRIALTIKNFNIPVVSYFGKTWHRVNTVEIGRFDDKLIKTLKPNLKLLKIDFPRYEKNSRISSNELGFRNNFNQIVFGNDDKRILAVGDSFTFGDQVSDQSTWVSCLERELKIKTDNGGYGGYSAGQSVRKAVIESKKRKYSHIIWSIFFQDFERDFSKNLIILNDEGELEFNNNLNESEKKVIKEENIVYGYFKEYSFLVYHFDYKVIPKLKNLFKQKKINKKTSNQNNTFYGIDYSLVERNIKFLLSEFDKINIKQKIILYQYSEHFKNSPYAEKIKVIIKENLKNYNFLIVDTVDEFLNYDEKKLRLMWFDHHTAFGNEVICKYIVKKIKKNKLY